MGLGKLEHLYGTSPLPFTNTLNSSEHVATKDVSLCKLILYVDVPNLPIQVWDLVMLVPNALFLIFILLRFNRARLKLRATSSPIFMAFYVLVVINVIISIIRCLVSMSVSAAAEVGSYVDTILWVSVRFFLLSTEISVIVFGLAFGHLDSRSSIRHVLLATSLISLAFSSSQAVLEVFYPDEHFKIQGKKTNVFGHGGMLFWFISSIFFTLLYLSILVLPWTRIRERLALPTKRSFYIYILFLVVLNISQSVGSGLLMYSVQEGLCIVDATACVYFTLFTPLVYHTFLSEFFGVSQPSIMFSYKAQVDDGLEDDIVSLPHQHSFSSLKTDSDYIYQGNNTYDSTQLDNTCAGENSVSLQSPDSIAGYSLDSQTIDLPTNSKQ
ncbi:transmembrane protein adipocyte-associated 1 homolog [Halyomorpha halys]|uniref:transmembrane protein adipocyte-associated 1 homolog n=1 Tax=Halyomorpha halys TaxID=286706 RepID=UPI0006D50527|nr:transmembrane protein adipocyte-associated 1 homolog [Halyomorpha halys]